LNNRNITDEHLLNHNFILGEPQGHYHPIPVHSNDMTGEFYDEALPSLVERLWCKVDPFRSKFQKSNDTSVTSNTEPNHEPSAFEKLRNENIKRNNELLRQLGMATIPEDAKLDRSGGKVKRLKKKHAASSSSSSSENGSCEEDSHDDDSKGDITIFDGRNSSTRVSSVPVVKADNTLMSTTKQMKPKNMLSIDLTAADYDEAVRPFLYLVNTTHYDPDEGEKKPDAGVFKVDSVVVEHYKDGDEVVVYRCKYNDMTREWNPVNKKDPIRVADVVQYTKNKRYQLMMNGILNMT